MNLTLFRNLTLYRLPAEYVAGLTAQALDQAISTLPLRELGGVEMQATGFLPLETLGGGYTWEHGNRVLFRLGRTRRLLPTSVINQHARERIDAIRVAENREPGAKERRRIRDEVFLELAPQAFPITTGTWAVLDLTTGWLWVDTATSAVAESVCTMLREAIGSFPAMPAYTDQSLRAIFTSWLQASSSPTSDRLQIGTHCVLEDPCEGGARITARDQEMYCEEVESHLQAGKQCTRLALHLDDALRFTLDDKLRITGIRFDDAIYTDADGEDPAAHTILTVAAVATLVAVLEAEFDLEAPL